MPECDVLVVGGGVAGLRAALAAHKAGVRVALLSKTHPVRSHGSASLGGFNAALSPMELQRHIVPTDAAIRNVKVNMLS